MTTRLITRRTALLGGVTLLSSVSALANRAHAQQPPTPAKKPKDIPPRERTLMDALSLARVMDEVTLTIGPQWEPLPKENLAPQNSSTLGAIAQAYKRAFRRFGGVAAIAPPLMDIINPNPTNPNPFDGMPEGELMPIFAASLKEEQWQALNSEGGLRLSSLSESQQKMIAGVFPSGEFKVRPWFDTFDQDTNNPKYIKEISKEWMSGAIRLKESLMFDLPNPAGEYPYGMFDHAPEGFEPYRILSREYLKDRLFGQIVRAEMPNMPKKGDLTDLILRSNIFLKPVSLENVTTVKEMMDRIAKATKIEIYADRRWHHKTLMILGKPKVATAGDLLRAMAYCLTGTFRKVGPAFVMTDDIIGYDTKRQRWAEFEKIADAMRVKYVEEAQHTLYDRYKDHVFSAFNDPEALTPEQLKSMKSPFGFEQPMQEPLSKFTPAQQKGIQRAIKKHEEVYKDNEQLIDKSGKIRVDRQLNLELLVPSIERPIRTDINLSRYTIMSPRPDDIKKIKYEFKITVEEIEKILIISPDFLKSLANINIEDMIQVREKDPVEFKRLVAKYPEFSLLNKKLDAFKKTPTQEYIAKFTHRGAWLTSKDKTTLTAEIEVAKRLSLTHLWLEVFVDGKITPAAMELWNEAIALTKGTKIKILPTMRVFSWGNTPTPAELVDLNVLGETSKERESRRQKRLTLLPQNAAMYTYNDYGTPEPARDVAVAPFSASVRETLVKSLQAIALKSGETGVVLTDINVPGYQKMGENSYISPAGTDMLMGYQTEMRLAFLRAESLDPIDVYKPNYLTSKANTEILNYRYDEGVTATAFEQWQKFRYQAWLECMKQLQKASITAKTPLFCYEQTGFENGYGSDLRFVPYTLWNDPKKEPPLSLRNRPVKNPNSIAPIQSAQSLRNQIKALAGNYAGFVLETKDKSLIEWEIELNKKD
jgi:hypothetical protein